MPSENATLPTAPRVHQLEALQNQSFGVFMETHYIDMNHWPLVMVSTSSLSPFPGGQGSGTERSSSPITWLVPLATSPHP